MTVRPATPGQARAAARLHVAEIDEGFLSGLGPAFLTRLYRRVVLQPQSFLLVADEGGRVAGFVAGTEDLAVLYRSFLVRDGLVAAARAAPRLARALPRVRETLRYGESDGVRPRAELLSVAVDRAERGRGLGRALVEAATAELVRRGVGAARVVAGVDNTPALALYQACGFRPTDHIEVHAGATSTVLTWP